jgi:hypothetical protein
VKQVLSIDLESWTHGNPSLGNNISSEERKALDDNHVKLATDFMLTLLKNHGATATFFVTGEILDWYPEVIEKIYYSDNELGFHSQHHKILKHKDVFKEELAAGKEFINTYKPAGFRAPQMFLKQEYIPKLREAGFKYDSSTYSAAEPFEVGGLKEVPVSSLSTFKSTRPFPKPLTPKLLLSEFPYGSGYFLGLLQRHINWFIRRNKKPSHIFVHPWQVFPSDLYIPKRYLLFHPKWWPYTRNVYRTFNSLLKNYKWGSIREVLL